MTNLNRIPTTGHSTASIFWAGLGGGKPKHDDIIYHCLRRIQKKEILELCEKLSIEKGLRLEKRVLP